MLFTSLRSSGNVLYSVGKYRIESLSAATFPGALEVIRVAFFQDENVCIGSEVNKNPLAAEELLELCADVALDGASLVAVTTDRGDVAAVAFTKIQVATQSPTEKPFFEIFAEERCSQPSSRSLVEYMATMDAKCNFFEKFNIDCSLEIMFLATLHEYRQQKLGTLLCEKSVELAKRMKEEPVSAMTVADLGPKYSMMKAREPLNTYPKICNALWTSKITQAIGKTLKFTVYETVPFTEFVYDGKTYADRIGPDSPFSEVAAYKLY